MSKTTENDPKSPQPELVNGLNYTGNKGPKFGVRHVQIIMMGLGPAIDFITKSSLSVAIVAMTDSSTSPNPNVPTYDWDNKSTIISSILWSGIGCNLIAGYLGKRFGPKWITVGAGLLNGVCFTVIPWAAQIGGSTGVIICRILQGIALGFIFSMSMVVMGRWVPPEERSRLGFVGAAITVISAMISSIATGYISSSYLGWPWIFYIFGALSITWAALYAVIGSQSADVHPRISPEEKEYILTTLFRTNNNEEPTPFREIFTSIPVWAIVVGLAGYNWVTVLLSTEMPIFLVNVLDYDLKSSGIISAIPALLGLVFGVIISVLSDLIPKKGILSLVNSRRCFHLTGCVGVSLFLFVMTYVPVEYSVWAVVLLCVSNVFVLAPAIGGAGINLLDIAPKFAGITSGFSQTISQSVSLFAPLTVQWMCTDESDATQWRMVFLTSGVITVITAIFYVVFASGERQPWETESDLEANIEVTKRRSSVIRVSLGLGA